LCGEKGKKDGEKRGEGSKKKKGAGRPAFQKNVGDWSKNTILQCGGKKAKWEVHER